MCVCVNYIFIKKGLIRNAGKQLRIVVVGLELGKHGDRVDLYIILVFIFYTL